MHCDLSLVSISIINKTLSYYIQYNILLYNILVYYSPADVLGYAFGAVVVFMFHAELDYQVA